MDGKKTEKGFRLPSAYTVLFIIIAATAVLTWLIPAGSYEYQGRNVVPGSYQRVEQNPQGLWDVLMAPIRGMVGTEADGYVKATSAAVEIAFFLLMIGGFLGIVNKTGALNAGLASTIRRFKGREKMLIPVLMILFALGGSAFGMAEETLAFYALIVPVMLAIGLDTVVATAIIIVGSGVGVLASTVNPFATGVASATLGISMGQGIGLRLLMLVALTGISILYVYRYACKVEKDPKRSLVYAKREEVLRHFSIGALESQAEISKKQKLVNGLFFATFVIMIAGLIPWDELNANFTIFVNVTEWLSGIPVLGAFLGKGMLPLGWWYFNEITMLFMAMAIIIAVVYKMKESEFINSFLSGAGDMLGVAIIVAVARGIQVVMNNGLITDTILNWGETSLGGLASSIFIVLTFIFYLPMSFLIPSTSGLAAATMGIMGPMGEFAGVNPELVVTAFQSASGLVNLITPTSASVIGGLALARIGLGTWFRFMGWLLAIQFLVICAILGIAAVL